MVYPMVLGFFIFWIFPTIHQNKFISLAFISSFFFALFVKRFIIDKGIVHKKYYLWVIFFLWVNILGEIYLYYTFIGLDKITHFFVAILLTCVIDDILIKKVRFSKLFVVLSVIGALTLWEIFDYVLYAYFGMNIMGVWINGVEILSPFDDTMRDIFYGIIGSISTLLWRKHGH